MDLTQSFVNNITFYKFESTSWYGLKYFYCTNKQLRLYGIYGLKTRHPPKKNQDKSYYLVAILKSWNDYNHSMQKS